jgi:hypothetical protein
MAPHATAATGVFFTIAMITLPFFPFIWDCDKARRCLRSGASVPDNARPEVLFRNCKRDSPMRAQ